MKEKKTFCVILIALAIGGISFGCLSKPAPITETPKPARKLSTFTGTVNTGSQLEVKSYCPEGLYLVADEGTYLLDQTTMLHLRLSSEPDGTKMLSDQEYVGRKVEIVGKYPPQANLCEALTCECEDYILVEGIEVIGEVQYCDADTPCPKGKECYQFEDEDKPICWVGDPCEKCKSKKCIVAESYPPQIFCE